MKIAHAMHKVPCWVWRSASRLYSSSPSFNTLATKAGVSNKMMLNRLATADSVEVHFTPNEQVFMLGMCMVKVLHGTLDIFGYRMEPSSPVRMVCSPKCFSLVPIKAVSALEETVVLFTSVSNGLTGVQSMQTSFNEIFQTTAGDQIVPGCWIVPRDCTDPTLRMLIIDPQWESVAGALAGLQSRPVIMVSGNRKVGKSTLCKYLVNRLLNFHPRVAFFDFDCGQSELTPPGFVSMAVKEEPFLKPAFASLHDRNVNMKMKFYGDMSPSEDHKHYLRTCEELLLESQVDANTPIVINTLGWISGLGFALLAHLLHSIRPTHVLAFSEDLKDDYVSKALFFKTKLPNDRPYTTVDAAQTAIAYFPHFVPNATNVNMARFSPADSRSLSFWCYFYGTTSGFDFGQHLAKRQPYVIGVDQLKINFLKPTTQRQFWPKLNCALVALHASNTECLGMGFIRAVDPAKRLMYLLTPVDFALLGTCDTMTVSSIALPPAIFTHGNKLDGPYLNFQSAIETHGFHQRKVRHNIARGSTR